MSLIFETNNCFATLLQRCLNKGSKQLVCNCLHCQNLQILISWWRWWSHITSPCSSWSNGNDSLHSSKVLTLTDTLVPVEAFGPSWITHWIKSTRNRQNFQLLLYHVPKLILCRLLSHTHVHEHKRFSDVTRKGCLRMLWGDGSRSRLVFLWRKDREPKNTSSLTNQLRH